MQTRRFWSLQEKLDILTQPQRDGLSINEVCRLNEISSGLWYAWKAKLLPKENTEHYPVESEVLKLRQENTRLKDIIVKLTERLTL